MESQFMNAPLKKRPSLRTILAIALTLLGVLVSAITTAILYNNFKLGLREELRHRLVSITTLAALQQDGDLLLKVAARDDEYYKIINDRNVKIRASDPDLRFVYTMRKNDQGIYFVVDANVPGDTDVSDFGQPYLEPGPTLMNNFDTISQTLIEPEFYTDEYGTFLSAYAPIYTKSGERVGVLGVDITADKVVAKERQFLNQSLTIFLFSLPIVSLLGYFLGGLVAAPLARLTATAVKIAEGNLDERAAVPVNSREAALLAYTFNAMTSRLRETLTNTERKVEERTAELAEATRQASRRAAQLQAVTELSEAIATLQNLNEILPAAARLISERFGFYHVGIFLVDRTREYAILQASNSEGGKRMLARSHRLRLGTGIVGFAAQTGQPRIALDVGTDAVFFDNPDLPDTRSEAALPLISRGETIGVLDMQSTQAGAFSNEDLLVLSALANQVSIALENARLLTEARAALTQVQEVYNEFTRAEWSRITSKARRIGYRYQAGQVETLDGDLQGPEIASAVKSGRIAASRTNGSEEKRTAVAVPVKLRGEVIGVLHIESNNSSREWHEEEVALVQAVAERAAFALENARLFQDARRRAAKESMISEATARISGALNIENILRTTAEELERVLSGSEVLIQFQTEEQK
jgi:GAF domain-containing protein